MVVTANLVFGVVVYYPMVHAVRPMDRFDWTEGTLFTGLLLAALGCTVLRLTGTTLTPGPARMDDPRSPMTDAHRTGARA